MHNCMVQRLLVRRPAGELRLIAPLRKKTLDGKLYQRTAEIEAKLIELFALSREDVIARAQIRSRSDPRWVPSECLLHIIRASRTNNTDIQFERLFRILMDRVMRSLPRPESRDGRTMSLSRSNIRDKVFGRFVELLSMDRNSYSEKLDYFEVRFDGALASLRRDAQEQVWRDENRSAPLEYNEETGEPSADVEQAAEHYDPFAEVEIDGEAYRSRLDAAIDALPPEQSRIIEMLRQEIPIDSKDPGAMTIAKALGRSEKTVRTYRDKAFAALRAALAKGEDS